MSKNRKVKKNTTYKPEKTKDIDEAVLSKAISKAYFQLEKQKKEEEQKIVDEKQKEWLLFLGQKEYSNDEKWYKKKFHSMRNELVCFWKIMFIKRNDIRDMRATFALMSLTIMAIFWIFKMSLYILCFMLGILIILKKVTFGCIIWSFVFWIFARIFRIAIYEIEETKDGNLLISIFSGVLSFLAVIIAVIALFME